MKSTELRIGNWVDAITGIKEGEYLPCKVTKILGDGLCIDSDHKDSERKDYFMSMDGYRSIPLTEEWYKRCGAKQYEIALGPLTTDTNFEEAWFIDNFQIPDYIKYVHELQNWYYWKFSKTELEIK